MRGEPRVAMTWFGEGSTANGQWHEAMNFAGVPPLPVVFMLENNQFAYSTPNEREFAVDPVARAQGYGFPGVKVDGNDVEAVFDAAPRRVERARGGGGPDADRGRDDAHARPRRARRHAATCRRRCSRSGRSATRSSATSERLVAEHGFGSDEVEAIRAEVTKPTSTRMRSRALASPMPDPAIAREGVFADAWRAARRRPGAVVALGESGNQRRRAAFEAV